MTLHRIMPHSQKLTLHRIIALLQQITPFREIILFRGTILLLTCLSLLSLTGGCTADHGKPVVIGNNHFSWVISPEGRNLHFTDRNNSVDWLSDDSASFCASVVKNGITHNITSLESKRKRIIMTFGSAGIQAEIMITGKDRDWVGMRVGKITGEAESLNFINIPLRLEAMPYEQFAACVLSMNLFTHVEQLPALQSHLRAECHSRFGMEGAEISVLGVPMDRILPVIREIMRNAGDVPFSDKGGAFAQLEKEGYGSYLMNFGSLTEESVDEIIDQCNSLGFNQVTLHGGNFFRHGEFEPDQSKWPDGWKSLKRINDRLHEAGISSILLTYTFFIDKNSVHVSPSASEDLDYFSSFTLAESIDQDDTEIVVRESTAGVSPVTGFFVRNSNSLRINGEIIEFTGVSSVPPYKFTGCKRGACGTYVTAHEAGEKAYHLKEMFGLFIPGPETELFSHIAQRTAEMVDACGFDGIYFDAIDGNDLLGGRENSWYYGTKFVFEVARHLKKPVGMEMCDMPHHYWHYSSRWQAWDRPVRGYKRFIDVHLAAIKSDDHRHGEWMGHSPEINRLAAAENGKLLLPLHLGWWANYTWNPPQVEPTFPDDVEYLCCKMTGNNAGLSMLGGTDTGNLNAYPLFARLVPIIRQYEELRHRNYFSDSVRALLRQPGKEFSLFRDHDGKWKFKPVSYQRHKIADTGHPTAKWQVNNEFEEQPLKLRIEVLMSVTPYAGSENILLSGLTEDTGFVVKESAKGVTGRIGPSDKHTAGGGSGIALTAYNSGLIPQEGAWLKTEKIFEPSLNLEKNQALGVWIKGDSCGELLNLRTESPHHVSMGARGDHFIKIDFRGWKYFELVEIESSEFNNYIWPDEYFNVYNSYFYTVHFDNIDKLQLWYNNLPAGKEVECIIGPVKALPLVPVTIHDPVIRIGEECIEFPVKLESGMFLEFNSLEDCKVYGSRGELISELRMKGEVPFLRTGLNDISFACRGTKGISSRVQVTIITEGNAI